MRKFLFLLLLLPLLGCSVARVTKAPERGVREPSKAPIVEKFDILLDVLKDPYVDLAKYGDTVVFSGNYLGSRIVLRNAVRKVLVFRDANVSSTSPEEALVLPQNSKDVQLIGVRAVLNQSITIWGVADNVSISGFTIRGAHVGVRATEKQPHRNIEIFDNVFEDIKLEGVYLGPSTSSTDKKGQHFYIYDNVFRNIGWDAIQVGDVTMAWIHGNVVVRAGAAGQRWQDYGITINPGCIAYCWDNVITNTQNEIQVLDSRVFFFKMKP